jgi:hypothetical protein
MIREDGEAEQIDAKAASKMLEQVFNPDLAMVVVVAGQWIGAQQEAAPDDTIHDVDNGDFIGRKDIFSGHACHHRDSRACGVG